MTFYEFLAKIKMDEWHEHSGKQGYWYKGKHYEWYARISTKTEDGRKKCIINSPLMFLWTQFKYHRRKEWEKSKRKGVAELLHILQQLKKQQTTIWVNVGNPHDYGTEKWYRWEEFAS